MRYLYINNPLQENKKLKDVIFNMGLIINEPISEKKEGSYLQPTEKMKEDFKISLISTMEGIFK